MFLLARAGHCETLRIATYHAEFSRDGPGLLLRDLKAGDMAEAISDIVTVAPDVLLLTDFDYDLTGAALAALQERLATAGHAMPHSFARLTNAGRPSGADLDGDGRLGEAEDALGFGMFSGQGGMALLAVLPFIDSEAEDFSALLWRDLDGSLLDDGIPGANILPLASDGHWRVPVALPSGGQLALLAFHAQTPVFDGPEDRNGRRNRDQIRFWADQVRLTPEPFILFGNANLDPNGGEGRRMAIRDLLDHPELQDPQPRSAAGALATVDWPDPELGDLRVSYVLPSAGTIPSNSGVHWPDRQGGPAHKLVWVDVEITP